MSNNKPVKHLPEQLKRYMFKPGQSGNPNGRPKGKVISEYLRDGLGDFDPKTNKPVAKIIAEKMLLQCIDGSKDAQKEVIDRTEGPVIQKHLVERREEISIELLNEYRLSLLKNGEDGKIPEEDSGTKQLTHVVCQKEEKSSVPANVNGIATVCPPITYLEPRTKSKPVQTTGDPFRSDKFGTVLGEGDDEPRGLGNRGRR